MPAAPAIAQAIERFMREESRDPTAETRAAGTAFPGVLLCFLLSGFAGLLYQTVWTREFAFVFGTSELAVAVVLAGYMGGLAAGAAIAARLVARIRRPVLVYGLLELGVALAALAIPYAIQATTAISVFFFGGLPEPPASDGVLLATYQLTAALGILLVPTVLMGATLPLLARYAVSEDRQVGPRIGLLYAINTLGAVFGTVATAFTLLPALGLRGTVWVGVAINGVVFLLAAWIARSSRPTPVSAAAPQSSGWAGPEAWILPLVLFGGGLSFVYEVMWTRLLSQVLGGSVYAFSTMLASFLAGITLGSAAAAPLARDRRRAVIGFAIAELGVAVCSRAAFEGLDRLPEVAASFGGGSGFAPARDALVSSLVLLPSTFFLGATFPFAVRLLARGEADAAPVTARVYAWNTVGGVIGALLAGFWILPGLGFAGTMRIASTLNASLALAVCAIVRPAPRVLVATGLALVIGLGAFKGDEPWQLLRVMALQGNVSERRISFFEVGRSSTVMLSVRRDGWRLTTNGLPESVITRTEAVGGAMAARWLAALPVLLRPEARHVLIVGFGGGATVEGVPAGIESIDVMELEPEVIAANRSVAKWRAFDPLADPRVSIYMNDVRGALALTDKKWDIITSQPSHPWTPGASHLYTREFVTAMRGHLTPGGVFVQWISAAFIDAELLRGLVASISDAFDHTAMYRMGSGATVLLVGSDGPLSVRPDSIEAIARGPEEFARAGIVVPEDALIAQALGGDRVEEFIQGARRSTDDYNLMLMRSPKILAAPLGGEEFETLVAPFDPVLAGAADLQADVPYLLRRLVAGRQVERAERLADESPHSGEPLVLRGLIELGRGDTRWAEESFRAALSRSPDSYEAAAGLYSVLVRQDRSDARPPSAALRAMPPAGQAVVKGMQLAASRHWAALEAQEEVLAGIEARDPLFALASHLRARWRLESEDPQQAAESFRILRRSLQQSRERGTDIILRARAAYLMGSAEQAEADLRQGLAAAQRTGVSRDALALAKDVLDKLPLGPSQPRRKSLEAALARLRAPGGPQSGRAPGR